MRSAIISKNTDKAVIEYLRSKDIRIIQFNTLENVAEPVRNHPDMLYCMLNENTLFKGDAAKLSPKYPTDISYNACSTGKFFIHNLKYTDPELMRLVHELGMTTVNVSQGYAKCSIVVVDEDSIITYDDGIAKACRNAGMDVLKISPGNVDLTGYDTGFIGGTSGKLDKEIIFNGNLELHPDYFDIRKFVESKGLSVKYFKDYKLTDIGTLFIGNFDIIY